MSRITTLLLWAAIILAACIAIVCSGSQRQWRMDYSAGTQLKSGAGIEWAFRFPKCFGHVNMITTSPWWGKKPPKAITMVVKIEQQGAHYRGLEHCDEVPPWTGARFYIQRKGDDMTCGGDMASYRWWSNPVTLRFDDPTLIGSTVTVKVKPNQWSNCWGKPGTSAPDLFWKAWANVDRVGLTFGPSCRAGHGICVDKGQSVLKLVSFK